MSFKTLLLCFFAVILSNSFGKNYEPNWKSLDSRPIPLWYDDAKFGIFVVWGLYAVPAVSSEWFWWYLDGDKPSKSLQKYMAENFRRDFTYQDFATMFTAELFDPQMWAELVQKSGGKYFVFTTKHHEGYCNWPSNHSWNWNSRDVGPKRDIVGELRSAILNKTGVHFGLYFSQFEWFNPLFLKDKSNGFRTQEYSKTTSLPQMYDLIENYRPDILWSDGDAGPDIYWNSTGFLAWLYNSSPVKDRIVVNDRWGNNGIMCHHGDFYTCADRYNPGHLLPHKWENAMTLDGVSWGYRRTMRAADILSLNQLITKLAATISCGGNLLLNVGPTHDGRIIPIFEERLLQLGKFLNINSEAVYSTKPWVHQNDTVTPNIWYTSQVRDVTGLDPRRLYNPQNTKNTIVYAWVTQWPKDNTLHLGAVNATAQTKIFMVGYPGYFQSVPVTGGGIKIKLSGIQWFNLPNLDAWVIKLEYLQNSRRNPLEFIDRNFREKVPKDDRKDKIVFDSDEFL